MQAISGTYYWSDGKAMQYDSRGATAVVAGLLVVLMVCLMIWREKGKRMWGCIVGAVIAVLAGTGYLAWRHYAEAKESSPQTGVGTAAGDASVPGSVAPGSEAVGSEPPGSAAIGSTPGSEAGSSTPPGSIPGSVATGCVPVSTALPIEESKRNTWLSWLSALNPFSAHNSNGQVTLPVMPDPFDLNNCTCLVDWATAAKDPAIGKVGVDLLYRIATDAQAHKRAEEVAPYKADASLLPKAVYYRCIPRYASAMPQAPAWVPQPPDEDAPE